LQVRQVDQSHWWVGTEATYDRFPVVLWTDPLGTAQVPLSERITQATGGQSPMVVDPQTGRALLLLPRFIVRQMPKILEGLQLKVVN
ncbi:MAG: hypothetical protein HKN47_28305, partial [Pirellulaceae bacterium]|nr:hypothetical protein [Pirellulaceae bacterium]